MSDVGERMLAEPRRKRTEAIRRQLPTLETVSSSGHGSFCQGWPTERQTDQAAIKHTISCGFKGAVQESVSRREVVVRVCDGQAGELASHSLLLRREVARGLERFGFRNSYSVTRSAQS